MRTFLAIIFALFVTAPALAGDPVAPADPLEDPILMLAVIKAQDAAEEKAAPNPDMTSAPAVAMTGTPINTVGAPPVLAGDVPGAFLVYLDGKPPGCDGSLYCVQIRNGKCGWVVPTISGRTYTVLRGGHPKVGNDPQQFAPVWAVSPTAHMKPVNGLPPAPGCSKNAVGAFVSNGKYTEGWIVLPPPQAGNAPVYRVGGTAYTGGIQPEYVWAGANQSASWQSVVTLSGPTTCSAQTLDLTSPIRMITYGNHCPIAQ